jgi:hypothetical protein
MADEEKPPKIVLEIEKLDAERRRLAVEAATRLANPLGEKLLAIEKISGLSNLTDKMRLVEENSDFKRITDSMRLFDENSSLRRLTESMRLMDENSTFKRIAEGLSATGELVRAARGPLWDLRAAGLLDIAGRPELDSIRKAIAGIESRSRLPALDETAQLAKLLGQNPLSDIAAGWARQESSIARAIGSMNTPWLDIHDRVRSIAGFAEMQGLGLALRNIRGFEENLSATLRGCLGDWRDPITWRPEILEDFKLRSDFYVDLGFNPRLTEFPLPAFEQSLDIAGFRQDVPPLIAEYGPPIPFDLDDEDGLDRTNNAHDWLQRLERLLRRFIDEQMIRAVGADWPTHRLPGGFRDRWEEKKRKAKEAGAPDLPLVCFGGPSMES